MMNKKRNPTNSPKLIDEATLQKLSYHTSKCISRVVASAVAGFLLSSAGATALVDQYDGGTEPTVYYFEMVGEAAPVPTPEAVRLFDEPTAHRLDENEVTILSRLLWSSPLRDERQKRQLLWVVFNRVDDESSKFPVSIEGNVVKSEFSFYDRHAHLSDTNDRIVREELNRWLSWLDGEKVSRPIPEGYIYCSFNGYNIDIMKEKGGERYE